MNISYSPTRLITTSDLFIACDPIITFGVKSKVTPEWARLHREWEDTGGDDIDLAMTLVSQAFVNVGQNGEVWKLGSLDTVKELRDSIEGQNPGHGDEFIITILSSFAFNHYNFLASRSIEYAELSTQSHVNGAKSSRVKVS